MPGRPASTCDHHPPDMTPEDVGGSRRSVRELSVAALPPGGTQGQFGEIPDDEVRRDVREKDRQYDELNSFGAACQAESCDEPENIREPATRSGPLFRSRCRRGSGQFVPFTGEQNDCRR